METQFSGNRVGRWLRKGSYAITALLVLMLLPGRFIRVTQAAAPLLVGNGTPESCTYVELYQAIADLPAGGTMDFNCGPDPVTIWIAELTFDKDLTIDGGGLVTFSGGDDLGDMLGIPGGVTIQMVDLTIANGEGACSGPIYNHGTLILQHVTLANNSSGHGCGSGAIFSDGSLTIEDSTIRGNFGGCDPVQCGNGGGIGNAGKMQIINSTISGNSSLGAGGGIDNSGTATIVNSTISGNSSLCGTIGWDETVLCFSGGGIRNTGTLQLVNSTVSGNTAGSIGGGIDNYGTLFLQNTTLVNNTAKSMGGLVNHSAATVQNSILADNLDSNQQPSDCSGTLTSQGYNLIESTSGCTFSGDTTGDLLGVDPLLGPLQNNGGPTFTQILHPGSPALDAGNPATPGSGGTACEVTDQRGVTRPQNGRCDMGAVEVDLSVVTVQIDIKPGSKTNPVNLKSKGILPVAILSTETFDAHSILPDSIQFAMNGIGPKTSSLVDVNGDGQLDLVLQFRIQQTGLRATDTQACLLGQTSDGMTFQGCDRIHRVP